MAKYDERFKVEVAQLGAFATVDELKRGLDRYIHYYNHHHIKLKLKGLSPVTYRTQALGA